MVERILCCRCEKLIGAVDTETGEHEWVPGAHAIEDEVFCRDCYNAEVLNDIPTWGGIDENFDIIDD